MSIQEFNTSLEFIKKTSSDELVKKHLKLVFDTYYKIFGEVCTGCPTKIGGYISRLKKHNKTIIMAKDKREFRLKKGAIIPVPGTSKAYSDINITDKIALEILKANPNRKSIFSKVPENLEELLEGAAQEKALKDYTVAELKEMYPKIEGKNKKELLENIQAFIDSQDVEVTLKGSTIQPATFTLNDNSVITLGDVVAKAQENSGLTPDQWNELSQEELEQNIQREVDELQLDVD